MAATLPKVYMQISHAGKPIGCITFSLYDDIAPLTAANFRFLAQGTKITPAINRPLTFCGSFFHRVIRNFMVQGGDITHFNGLGGYSIYGRLFKDENFAVLHDRAYLLSMANAGPHTNSSQFFITTKPCPHLNGKHVVFGEVCGGHHVVDYMQNVPTDTLFRPRQPLLVQECGLLSD
uniref:Peptidyl-prolyl cis-trans isomerase n=2 Tax=Lygus hesperus TaxID=30085 RepID=A0A0A9Y264_LYGHE